MSCHGNPPVDIAHAWGIRVHVCDTHAGVSVYRIYCMYVMLLFST